MGRRIEEPCTIILDHGANPPTFWVVKSKRKVVAVLDDGSVLYADFKGQLWEGASTINNRQLARDIAMRFGHGVSIGDEYRSKTPGLKFKVKDLRRDEKAIVDVLESRYETTPAGTEMTITIDSLKRNYEKLPREEQQEEVRDEG